MRGTPILLDVCFAATHASEDLQPSITLTEDQRDKLLNELERAMWMVLDGELLGVKIIKAES